MYGSRSLLTLVQEGRTYDERAAYAQSKTANILFAVELAARLGRKGVTAVSAHPGGIWNTNLMRDVTDEQKKEFGKKS